MPEPIKINTSKYNKQGKVDIDGHIWDVKLPGAGTELRLSQAFRASKLYSTRISLLDKKIGNETITEDELDKYETYAREYEDSEKTVLEFFTNMFIDGTPDNSEVKAWIAETPTAIIQLSFEDIKRNANGTTETSTEEEA